MPRMHVADSRVRSAIKRFLESMKACDADIPEELAEDALEMAEEVSDALNESVEDEEADVLEVTKDAEEKLEAKIEDAVARALRSAGLVSDSSTKALDELEAELKDCGSKDDCGEGEEKVLDADGEEDVTVDPDKMKDTAAEMWKFIREIKPVIASVPNARTRKRLTDSVVKIARLVSNDSQYSGILQTAAKAAKDSMTKKQTTVDADADFGMDVAARFNPHYKKEG